MLFPRGRGGAARSGGVVGGGVPRQAMGSGVLRKVVALSDPPQTQSF